MSAREAVPRDGRTVDDAAGLCVHQAFEAQARRAPDAVAIVYRDQRVTYAALNRRANRYARRLRDYGVQPEALVGVCGDRTPELVAALIGIMKAGGGYVPIDRHYPPERATYMVEAARVRLVLTTGMSPGPAWLTTCQQLQLESEEPGSFEGEDADCESGVSPDNVAAVIFTSGSSGLPKGVVLPHRSLMARLRNGRRPESSGVSCQKSSISITAHFADTLGPLLQGLTMLIVGDETISSLIEFATEVSRAGITRLRFAPTHLRAVLDNDEAVELLGNLRTVVVSGEALTPQLVGAFRARFPDAALVNAYGLTETCGLVSMGEVTNPDVISIGTPVPGATVYVVDEAIKEVPSGDSGELCVAGPQLARGYLQSELGAERFTPNPFTNRPGDRIYRTGDRVRRLPDGTLEFLGRFDHQVKLRGFRIELGEIETGLRGHPAVRNAVVVQRDDLRGNQRLVAYTVQSGTVPADQLRQHLEGRLPTYMIPSVFVVVDRLPVLPGGKVDRSALPDPPPEGSTSNAAIEAPGSPTEEALARAWARVLQLPRVGLDENFFELGGDSLSAARLFLEIARHFGVRLPLSSMYRHGTIRKQALLLTDPLSEDLWSPLVPLQSQGTRPPLFLVHGIGGEVMSLSALVRNLGADQPCYGLRTDARRGGAFFTSVEELAALYLQYVRQRAPGGPYRLAGYSSGGVIAFEMAHQLRRAGEQVAALIMLDSILPGGRWTPARLYRALTNMMFWVVDDDFFSLSWKDRVARVRAKLRAYRPGADVKDRLGLWRIPDTQAEEVTAHFKMIRAYRPRPYPGTVSVLRARSSPLGSGVPSDLGWRRLALGGVDVRQVRGAHNTILNEPRVSALAAALKAVLSA